MNYDEQKYREATTLTLNHFSSWNTQQGWKIKRRGIRGIYLALCQEFGLTKMSEQVFRNYFGHGKAREHPHTYRIMKALYAMIEKCEYCYHEESKSFTKEDDSLIGRSRISMDKKIEFLQGANNRIIIVQTFVAEVSLLLELFEEKYKENPNFEIDIFLPHPEGLMAKFRNSSPHPDAAVSIPSRIEENEHRMEQFWKNMDQPPNFRLWRWPEYMIFTLCLYGKDKSYLYAPYWPHKWADHGPFQYCNGQDSYTRELEKCIEYLKEHGTHLF